MPERHHPRREWTRILLILYVASMSNSIFHVRPLDSGKGWAIDEYDGHGAWQHSVLIGPDEAPMDKIQAQRAVSQLRRKAVNSAKQTTPVNMAAPHAELLPGERIDFKKARRR